MWLVYLKLAKKIERKIENSFFSGTQRAEDYQGGKVLRLVLTDERELSFAFFFLKRMATKNIDSKFLKSKTGAGIVERHQILSIL